MTGRPVEKTASPLVVGEPTATAAVTVGKPTATTAGVAAQPTATTCSSHTKRETQCLAKNTGPASQVPNPVYEFDAQGCVAASHLRTVCNGVHDVLSGPNVKGGDCCYVVCTGVVAPCGRPLSVATDSGRATRVASSARREDWTRGAVAFRAPAKEAAIRTALAEAWLEDALQEHASVASFARFVLELLSVGAPHDLVAAATQAGLDEVEHARLCFELASAADGGRALGPGPLLLDSIEPRRGLAAIAAAVAEEACCGETFAALAAERASKCCADARTAGVLERIADDEARHAELGWRFVAWALGRGDEGVVAEVEQGFERGLATLLAAEKRAATTPADWDLRAAGRLTGVDLASCLEDARTLVESLRRDELRVAT
jgi:hypothetical protein